MAGTHTANLKILASHPIQYQIPVFRELVNRKLAIEVAFYHQGTAGRRAHDAEFGLELEWDLDLLSGYPHRILLEGTATYSKFEQLKLLPRLLLWALENRRVPLLLVGWFAEIIWLMWLLRVVLHVPVLVLCETTPGSFAAVPKPGWRNMLLGWLLRHTRAGLTIGANNHAFYRQMGVPDDQLFHTPYSIDNARFAAEAIRLMPDRKAICAQFGLKPDVPTFVFCGKFIAKKRPVQLLKAFLAADLQERAQLVFIGGGELRGELEQIIRAAGTSNVHLAGFLNQSQMPLAYVMGELMCLLSDATETWGLVVNEALVCGRPVIVSAAVGCAPDLVSCDNGWIVPLDDHEALVQTLRNACNRYADWQTMGKRGQDIVAHHTFAAMATGMQQALASLSKSDQP